MTESTAFSPMPDGATSASHSTLLGRPDSPCIGICNLDDRGLCEGCHRTGQEIAAWSVLDDATRLHLMDVVLPARAPGGAGG